MIANKNIINTFFSENNKKALHNWSMSIEHGGNRLYSYYTCIAQFVGKNEVIINNTKYSVTTSKQQTYVRYYASQYGYKINYVENVPLGAWTLLPYLKK